MMAIEKCRYTVAALVLTGAFELTLRNADKPDLDYLTVYERLTMLADDACLAH